jgi:hypothetical protein
MEIRSYRSVFQLERRIYRVDRVRLNPGGIPVRGIVYFLALGLLALLADRAPGAGVLVAWVPWYVRDLALPALAASLLAPARVSGRPFHLAANALLRHAVSSRRRASLCRRIAREGTHTRWFPPVLLMLPDGCDGELRALRYIGPGALRVSVAHECVVCPRRSPAFPRRRPDLVVRRPRGAAATPRSEVIVLERAARVEIH